MFQWYFCDVVDRRITGNGGTVLFVAGGKVSEMRLGRVEARSVIGARFVKSGSCVCLAQIKKCVCACVVLVSAECSRRACSLEACHSRRQEQHVQRATRACTGCLCVRAVACAWRCVCVFLLSSRSVGRPLPPENSTSQAAAALQNATNSECV